MPSIVSVQRSGSSSGLSHSSSFQQPPSVQSTPRRTASLKKVNKSKPKGKGRSSISTLTFEEPESTVFIDREMLKNSHMDTAPTRRGLVRIDQDGPWSVSVAESPHDARSYSLYIKTPTHNLTLTRTAMEIIELDHKLHDSILSTSKLPPLPLDPSSVPAAPKRKSAFLNTLSRLASPTSAKSGSKRPTTATTTTSSSSTATSTTPSGLPTPATSPSVEQTDPFVSFSASTALLNATLPAPSATSTALAAYFTTLSNLQPVRQARAWKRFVRVRTDDLESTRVERAIKRVRSDLAAHVGRTKEKKERGRMNKLIGGLTQGEKRDEVGDAEVEAEGQGQGEEGDVTRDGKELPDVPEPKLESGSSDVVGREEQGEEEEEAVEPATPSEPSSEPVTQQPTPPATAVAEVAPVVDLTSTPRVSEDEPRTPSAAVPPSSLEGVASAATATATSATTAPAPPRMPRSHSADPDRRMSRAYHSSVSGNEGNLSSSQTETGDESSSLSTAARKSTRKKRNKASRAGGGGGTSTGPSSARASLNGSQKDISLGGGALGAGGGTIRNKKSQRKVVVDDFEMLRVLGKGCAGKVLLVRHRATADLYAMKAITKRHVLAHQELQHTLTEQAVLKRMAAVDEGAGGSGGGGAGSGGKGAMMKDPFVVKLWWSFHDKENLFLVMDFHPGGDLATQLARWGRLGRDRARFYAAEIVEGVEGLHAAGVIYRDLKPENILIGADGHIVLTDFGLSKEFPRRRDALTAPSTPSAKEFGTGGQAQAPWMRGGAGAGIGADGSDNGHPAAGVDLTTTFCGTAEYLAPEVIQALPYSYEVDWWSFGTMLYEMLTGITPFWANNHSDMYVRVLQDELQFPDDRSLDQDTKSLIRGLLQRNPALRICEPRIKRHPYFSMIDWSHVYYKRYIPPYIPPIDPSNASDTQNFDDTFLDMEPVLDEFNDETEQTDTDQDQEHTDTDRDTNTTPSQSRSSSLHPGSSSRKDGSKEEDEESVDVFDGYSFKGRHSVLIDDEEEEEDGEEDGTDEEEDEEGEEEEEGEGDEDEDIASSSLGDLAPPPPAAQDSAPLEEEEEAAEPKTPEARPKALPKEEDVVPTATPSREPSAAPEEKVAEGKPRKSKELSATEAALPPLPPSADKPAKPSVPPKSSQMVSKPARAPPPRRKERSGVHALDKYISDGPDEMENTEREDDEDEDWDFIEADGGEDRNGSKGTSLFARGVVDRYRLAVFRKASTPSRSGTLSGSSRSVSALSKASSEVTASPGEESPSPSVRSRGRNPGVGSGGLTFRKTPRQFLRPRSPPPSSYSSKSGKSLNHSNSASGTMMSSSTSSSGGAGGGSTLLTPATSLGGIAVSPSLKSKESAASVGAQSHSSDTSANGDAAAHAQDVFVEEPEKQKNKKLKKYKENAEKVFSIFSNSQRPSHSS
ncbi:hypothetical protein GYMLUDRAFT_66785 [Collybiopsis luxurians FD-317 M1]|nr:hypothetical protein GYMLUDRAFT_66785 [Collybiopsis luxurians FD-317 M1]